MRSLTKGIVEPLPDGAPGGARIFAFGAIERFFEPGPNWLAAICAVVALQIALIVHHVAWLDEWQALLIVEQSPNWTSLLESLRYEGHPPLWYGLLQAVGSVVPFDHVLSVSSALIALPLQLLILLRAPFVRSERLMLALGELALFEYGTVARGLALGALLMITVAALWRSRWVWLPIALLPLTDFLFGVIAVIFVALRWRSKGIPPAVLRWQSPRPCLPLGPSARQATASRPRWHSPRSSS